LKFIRHLHDGGVWVIAENTLKFHEKPREKINKTFHALHFDETISHRRLMRAFLAIIRSESGSDLNETFNLKIPHLSSLINLDDNVGCCCAVGSDE
jgi:hypothetical protein